MEKENIVNARNAIDNDLETRRTREPRKEAGMSEELRLAIEELIQRLKEDGPIEVV